MIKIFKKKFELDLEKVLPENLLPNKTPKRKTPKGSVSPVATRRSGSQKSNEEVKEIDYYEVYVPILNVLEGVEQEKKVFDEILIKKMIAHPRPDPKSLGN